MDAEPDDLPLIRCAVYTRQSVVRAGDDPALASCALQRTLCTEFIRSLAWRGWYPIGEHFDDEGYSGATIERPGLERLTDLGRRRSDPEDRSWGPLSTGRSPKFV